MHQTTYLEIGRRGNTCITALVTLRNVKHMILSNSNGLRARLRSAIVASIYLIGNHFIALVTSLGN